MNFIIADTFQSSLSKLTAAEQSATKVAVYDLQANPAHPSHRLHKLDRANDKCFHSISVNMDIRVIVHKSQSSFLVCYVAHHDDAYRWAERRKLETHPTTGAAQLVEVREKVIEVPVYREVDVPVERKPIFERYSDERILGYGVPPEWLADVRNVRDEDGLLSLVEHLPSEAADALLTIFDGGVPTVAAPDVEVSDPFQHPDAQKRFRLMTDSEDLKMALDFPWEQWTVFLHPTQRELVEKEYGGPARVTGSAGTGKTIVALHRAVHLAKQDSSARILLATFSDSLAAVLRHKLRILISSSPRLGERIEVHSMRNLGRRFYELKFSKPNVLTEDALVEIMTAAAEAVPENRMPLRFLLAEWHQVVDAQQLHTLEDYLNAPRIGRRTALPARQREVIWPIYRHLLDEMARRNLVTDAEIFRVLTEEYDRQGHPPFEYTVVDEAQDINPSQLRFLAAMCGNRKDGLFFAGDIGQRIFQIPFSWLSLGVDIRGRSRGLKINYRTSHQIRAQADRLLASEIADYDGVTDTRRGTVSVFSGPAPEVKVFDSPEDETVAVAEWVARLRSEGFEPHEIAVIVRSAEQLDRAKSVMETADIEYQVLDDNLEVSGSRAAVGTMHMAKGLEFRAVAVMGCDFDVIPSQSRVENISDETELAEVYDTERHLLYVACTRARDQLLVTAAGDPSEFLDDLGIANRTG